MTEDVLLVVEVVSPATTTTDRIIKPQLYAAAGIPWFLRVELEVPQPPELWLYRAVGNTYAESDHASAGTTLNLTEPIELRLDPTVILRR
ncbi:MAG TPA: Uma2 family endonuclease [Actinomycetes bacterium]